MVAAKSSNERPYVSIPTSPRSSRNSMSWSTYLNRADDGRPPAVPPKDPQHNPVFLSPVSNSFPPNTPTRPRYTSFSVYEPQSANLAFPEPQPHRLSTRRSVLGLAPQIRRKSSRNDVGPSASTSSLWGPGSNRGSYVATVGFSVRPSRAPPDSTPDKPEPPPPSDEARNAMYAEQCFDFE